MFIGGDPGRVTLRSGSRFRVDRHGSRWTQGARYPRVCVAPTLRGFVPDVDRVGQIYPGPSRYQHERYRVVSGLTAKSLQAPGTPFSSCSPRSAKSIPEPITRSLTVLDTSTSPAVALAPTRAAM
jgi:hypothetical protein